MLLIESNNPSRETVLDRFTQETNVIRKNINIDTHVKT